MRKEGVLMSWSIDVFKDGTGERELLEKAALILTFKSPNRYQYYVGETYFDFGQNWKWTTVLCRTGETGITGSYQALNPAEQEKILLSDGSLESMAKIADEVLSDKFCPDRIRKGVA